MSIQFTPSWLSLIGKSRHSLYPHPQSDVFQINAPKYNSDIDGQTDLLPDIQPSTASHTASTAEESLYAKNIQEDIVSDAPTSDEHRTSSQDTNRPESQSPPIPDNTNHSVHQDTEQPDNAAISADNTNNAATDRKKSDDAVMSDDNTDNAAMSDDNTDDTT